MFAKILRAALCATLLSLLAAPGQAQTMQTIRVSYIPFENSGQLFYGKEMGFFAKQGIDVDLQPNPFGAAIASSVASNAIDIGYATVMTLALARNRHIPFVIVAPANAFSAARPPNGMLMAKNPDIKTGKDLNGKTIGTPGLNTLGEYGVRAWVDAGGGDSSTLKFVELPFPEMGPAIANGRVDAAYVADPFRQTAKTLGVHEVAVELDAVAKDYLVAGWFTTADWAKAHPDLVKRFVTAMTQSAEWAQKNPGPAVDILVKYLKVEKPTLMSSARAYIITQLAPGLIQPGIDVTARYAKFPTFPASDLIYSPSR